MMPFKTLVTLMLLGAAAAFAPQAGVARRSTLRMVAINSPDEAQRLAEACMQGGCDVYEREAVVKHLLQTKRELKAEMTKIDGVLREVGYVDDEDNFINFIAAAVMRNFGGMTNEPPPANTDGYATGYTGEKPKKRWTWKF